MILEKIHSMLNKSGKPLEFKQVSKLEFYRWVEAYRKRFDVELRINTVGFADPHVKEFHDLTTTRKPPMSRVAYYLMNEVYGINKKNEYFILKEISDFRSI